MVIFAKNLLLVGKVEYVLTVITNPAGATCVLTVDGISQTTKSLVVEAGKTVNYSVSYSGTTTKTGSITMDSNKTLTFTRTYSTNTTEQSWTQPILSSNGTIGGNSFAIYSKIRANTSENDHAYVLFDGITTQSTGIQITHANGYLIFYNPVPLKVSNLKLYSRSGWVVSKYTLYGSNDNSNWTQIGSYSGNSSKEWSQAVTNNNSYQYYKIDLSGNRNNILIEIKITATTQQTSYTYYFDLAVS